VIATLIIGDDMSCEHRGCRCTDAHIQRGGRRFCSERCAEQESAANPEPSCHCGHPDCAA